MSSVIYTALALFLITHIDTFAVLTAFCADDDYRRFEIIIGHYTGFLIGLFLAIGSAVLAAEFLQEWTFLLGLLPFAMGIWGLIHYRSTPDTEPPIVRSSRGRIVAVTAAGIGLSGENIAVFVPFFAELTSTELGVIAMTYTIAAGGIYLAAEILGHRVASAGTPQWVDRWLVPSILTVVGLYVLASGII